MNDLKREFLGYLRSVYGGEPMPTSEGSLPPLDAPTIYPAFREVNLNQGLGMLGGMGAGMGMQPGMGMQQPGMGMLPNSVGQPMQGSMLGGGSAMGGTQPDLMQAQNVLLNR